MERIVGEVVGRGGGRGRVMEVGCVLEGLCERDLRVFGVVGKVFGGVAALVPEAFLD